MTRIHFSFASQYSPYRSRISPEGQLPASIEARVFENDDVLRGSSSVVFDGTDLSGFVYDDVAFIAGVGIDGGEIFVNFVANGYDSGKFKSNSAFAVVVDGGESFLELHTSCSQPILLNSAYAGLPDGEFTITGGVGECVPGNPDCPVGDKIYELSGLFNVPLAGCAPGEITFNAYKDDDDLKGSATAMWTGSGLSDIVCDGVACLLDAGLDGDNLLVNFDVFGWKGHGEFDSNISLEIDLGACGSFMLTNLHASCSQVVYLNVPLDMAGGSNLTLTDGCGICLLENPVPTEKSTWGAVKSLY